MHDRLNHLTAIEREAEEELIAAKQSNIGCIFHAARYPRPVRPLDIRKDQGRRRPMPPLRRD